MTKQPGVGGHNHPCHPLCGGVTVITAAIFDGGGTQSILKSICISIIVKTGQSCDFQNYETSVGVSG